MRVIEKVCDGGEDRISDRFRNRVSDRQRHRGMHVVAVRDRMMTGHAPKQREIEDRYEKGNFCGLY